MNHSDNGSYCMDLQSCRAALFTECITNACHWGTYQSTFWLDFACGTLGFIKQQSVATFCANL